MKYFKLVLFFIVLITTYTKNVFSIENKILLKIDKEIITSIDVFNEIRYLTTVNENLKNMNQGDIYKIAINSLIREKVKKIEIYKNVNEKKINIDENYLNEIIKSTRLRLGFKNETEFNNHLLKNDMDINTFREKISLEMLWNELVYSKFSNKVKIDRKKLRNKIISSNNLKKRTFLLSEILFKVGKDQTIDQKYELIKKDIIEKSFSNAVLLHSISSSSNTGGKLGWVNESALNPKIYSKVSNLKVGEYTKPITVPGGFLIIQLNDIKEVKKKFDVNQKLEQLIKESTNQQLTELSNIYFDKVKKDITINEL